MENSQKLPRVGILIANYNYDQYLEKCIESAHNQTYGNFDLLIVDSNSSDNSVAIIDEFTSQFTKIGIKNFCAKTDTSHRAQIVPEINNADCEIFSYKENNHVYVYKINEPTTGPSTPRNLAIADTLEMIDAYQILDADDEMYLDKVETFVQYLYQSSHIGVVYGDYDILNEQGNTIREYKEPYDKLRLLQECIVHSGAMVKKDALGKVADKFGIYDREMRTCEDYDLWLRISEQMMIVHVPESHSLVRVHNENATYSVDKQVWESNWQRIQQKMQARHQNK